MKSLKCLAIVCLVVAIASCGNKTTTETATTQAVDGITTSTFKVWGNCDMCKETIEGSLKVDGVTKAEWDTESKIMTISYDAKKITLDQIQKNIADVGYDDEKYKGNDIAYKSLPECCQYDRK